MADDDEIARLRARVKELERDLARAQGQIESVVANIPAHFYVKDLENRYVYGSPRGFAMFGVDVRDAIGKTDAEIFAPELAARFAASDRRVLDGLPLEDVSYDVPTPMGRRHYGGVRFVVRLSDGTPIGVCGFALDVTERVEMAKKLEMLAITDALTELANRRRFDEHFEAEVARAARSGEPLSLVLGDVDHFKRYNDRYGHPAGDVCLADVAGVLRKVARRPADLAARYGGEEFALILPSTNAEGAAELAERVRLGVRELAIPHADNGPGVVTVSLGVATVLGGWPPGDVLALADRALYRAKDEGRDRLVLVEEERPPASVRRLGR